MQYENLILLTISQSHGVISIFALLQSLLILGMENKNKFRNLCSPAALPFTVADQWLQWNKCHHKTLFVLRELFKWSYLNLSAPFGLPAPSICSSQDSPRDLHFFFCSYFPNRFSICVLNLIDFYSYLRTYLNCHFLRPGHNIPVFLKSN